MGGLIALLVGHTVFTSCRIQREDCQFSFLEEGRRGRVPGKQRNMYGFNFNRVPDTVVGLGEGGRGEGVGCVCVSVRFFCRQ